MHNVFQLSCRRFARSPRTSVPILRQLRAPALSSTSGVKCRYNGSGIRTAWRDHLSPDLITRNHREPMQPTPSRVASEATCVQRQWVSCVYATSECLPSFLKSPQLSLAAFSRAFPPRRSWRSTPVLRRVSTASQRRAAPRSTWLRRSGAGLPQRAGGTAGGLGGGRRGGATRPCALPLRLPMLADAGKSLFEPEP
jgi:hypothetical protein